MNRKQQRMATALDQVREMKAQMPTLWTQLELGGAENQKLAVTFYLDKNDSAEKSSQEPIRPTIAAGTPEDAPRKDFPTSDRQTQGEIDLISDPQAKRFYAIAMGAGYAGHNEDLNEILLQKFGVKHQKDLRKSQYTEACSLIEEGWDFSFGGRVYD